MQTKTYFANTVPAALDVARQELGEDALLVNSRPTPAHSRQFGRLEVTFAWDPPEAAAAAIHDGPRAVRGGSELDSIRQEISMLRSALGRNGDSGVEKHSLGEKNVARQDSFVVARLCGAGLERATACDIDAAVSRSGEDPQSAVAQELARRIPIAPFTEMKPGESRTLALIGPPGRGKTVSLVKMAVSLGLARRIPVRIYSVGSHGIGGQEQIARYAAILGTPCQSYESVENLNLALNGDNWRGLALIDTPGLSQADEQEMRGFARFFGSRPEIEKHLVLRADARSADMLRMASRFAGLEPSRLLFTGLDEALSCGAMIETLLRAGIPATFAGTGQGIPDDLEEVNAGRLASALWIAGAAPAATQTSASGLTLAPSGAERAAALRAPSEKTWQPAKFAAAAA